MFATARTMPQSATKRPLHAVLGTGPLARATVKALLSMDLPVRVISRTGTMAQSPGNAEQVRADITDRETFLPALGGVDVIYFCAQPPYHRWPDAFPALQSAAIAAARETGAHLVVADNLYGYGPVETPMREDMPLAPQTVKGRVRAAMHADLVTAQANGGLCVTIARGSDFFGPHVVGSVIGARAMKAVFGGRTVEVAGDPDVPHSYTFVGDFGRALAILGTRDEAPGGIWHVPNAAAVSTRRLFEIAARLAGQRARLRRMSRIEMRLVGLFIPPVRETIEMLYAYERPYLVDHAKFVDAFGDISTPIEAALATTLAWHREMR